MAKRTNTVMQVAFFAHAGITPEGLDPMVLLTDDINERFKHKG